MRSWECSVVGVREDSSCTGRTKPRLCKRNRPTVGGRVLTRSVDTTPKRGNQSLMLLQHVTEDLHNTYFTCQVIHTLAKWELSFQHFSTVQLTSSGINGTQSTHTQHCSHVVVPNAPLELCLTRPWSCTTLPCICTILPCSCTTMLVVTQHCL